MNQQEESAEENILQLIAMPQNCEAFANLAEAGIDQLLQDGFLRDVPVLGSMIGVIRAAGGIRNLLLTKKLGQFLRSIQSIPLEDRQRYCEHCEIGLSVNAKERLYCFSWTDLMTWRSLNWSERRSAHLYLVRLIADNSGPCPRRLIDCLSSTSLI